MEFLLFAIVGLVISLLPLYIVLRLCLYFAKDSALGKALLENTRLQQENVRLLRENNKLLKIIISSQSE